MSNIRSRIQKLEAAQLKKGEKVRVFEVHSDEEQERLSSELEGKYPGDLIVFIRKFSRGAGEQHQRLGSSGMD